ncbi:MAG: heme o synthase [Candidatus Thalassarchaeaceae archaeon]
MMGAVNSYFSLTKPKVVILLQITALCSVLSHDLIGESEITRETMKTILIVLVGGYLTAGGANAINMWYDRDIDPIMTRTSNRPLPKGEIEANNALIFGILISVIGTIWFSLFANNVAAFWAAFSVVFYVFIYSMWLKRNTPQNIVIGGIAGSTPPVIGWAAAEEDLKIEITSVETFFESIFNLGPHDYLGPYPLMPWFMFILIFLWTPPHFWALALYRSKEYEKVGVPMMPNVKGKARTLIEMKIYSIFLIFISFVAFLSYTPTENWNTLDSIDSVNFLVSFTATILSIWYATTVWNIDVHEKVDEAGRMSIASRSFFVSLLYLALMFIVLVTGSLKLEGAIIGLIIVLLSIYRSEIKNKK